MARVEQTETPEMLKERNDRKGTGGRGAAGGRKDKVVARELCSVLSRGTRTYCHLDDLTLLEEDNPNLSASILMCIVEKISPKSEPNNGAITEYGICVVDTVIGNVTLTQLEDDGQRNRLRTLLARFSASEVLLGSGAMAVAPETLGALQLLCPKVSIEYLSSPAELPADSLSVLHQLSQGAYYKSDTVNKEEDSWPPVLKACADARTESQGGSSSTDLVLRALGGCIWQLKRSQIDYEILSLKRVFAYIPPDDKQNEEATDGQKDQNIHGQVNTN